MIEIPIPERLRKFPMYHGMLVHFTVYVHENGVPDFRIVHEANRQLCMADELCNMCGEPLEKPMVFIGGDACARSRLFVDGPMHEECAVYAAKVCPFLNNTMHQYSKRAYFPPGVKPDRTVEVVVSEEVSTVRPARMVMLYTNGYRIVEKGEGYLYLANPPLRIDWDLMPTAERPKPKKPGYCVKGGRLVRK